MALSGIIYGTTSNDKISMWIDWSATQNLDENYSVITLNLYYSKETSYNTSGYLGSTISCYGQTSTTTTYVNMFNGTPHLVNTLSNVKVPHNIDGTLSVNVTANGRIGGTTLDSSSINATITLNQIPRQTTLVSAPNFTDEQNPTIVYNNPVGNSASLTLLQACISLDGSKDDIAYRNISKTGTSYTFNLTEEERNVLRASTPNSNTRTVRFYIKCILNGKTLYDSLSKTLTIVNASPTLGNVSVVDTNIETTYLTGDKNTLIKYFSNAQATFSPAALKYATLKTTSITNGNTTLTSSGMFNNVENNSFVFFASDSRSNATQQTVTKTMVNYLKLTCSAKAVSPNTEGNASITISGNYWSGNFGAYENELIILYRHKIANGEFGEWQAVTITPTLKDNTYTVTVPLSDLDYRKTHTFQARAADKLMTVDSEEHKVRTVPVFDWGDNDFNFNVPTIYTIVPEEVGETAKEYCMSGAAIALSSTFELETKVTASSPYTVVSGSSHLVGGTFRGYFNVTRNSASGTGNITNETVCHFSCKHDGRINSIYAANFMGAPTGPLAAFSITNQKNYSNTIEFDVVMSAVGTAGTEFSSYFTLPCTVNVNYWR